MTQMTADPPPVPDDSAGRTAFIRAHTVIDGAPLLPEFRLHLATEITPLWEATEAWLDSRGVPPPFWAFAWAGGQGLARYILDHPETVRGRRILDFATGGGMVALAAARAGAMSVRAVEIDPFAVAAARLNAALNGLEIEPVLADMIGRPLPDVDVLLAGDICYERPLAEGAMAWFRDVAATGTLVLFGDPGRTYLPREGLAHVATYTVPTSRELEDRDERETKVWRVPAA